MTPMRRIVLTGGPGAGKSVIATSLATRSPDRFSAVPEAATLVYRRLGMHWNQLDTPAREDVQRQIYRLQIEQEQAASSASPPKTLLLDRGTVDGAAYWPHGPDDYWHTLQTTLDAEYQRYDAVIWLQTSAAIGAYDGDRSNSARREAPTTAVAIGRRLRDLWSGHPRFWCVDAYPTMDQKITAVERIINTILGNAAE